MISAGIVGGTGYVAGELLRILMFHPEIEIDFVYSHTQPGKLIAEIHQDLFTSKLVCTNQINPDVSVVFLCLEHGAAQKFISQNAFSDQTRIIDLSSDFRLAQDTVISGRQFVYGLPELNRATIKTTQNIANPGCFATAIELALLPLAKHKLLQDEVHIHGITGSTGAGQTLTQTSHFSWRQNNLSIYKAFSHQHLSEIRESLCVLQSGFDQPLNFIPIRGDFTRGIFVSMYTKCSIDENTLHALYSEFYKDARFTSMNENTIHLKQVVNTNHCLLQVQQIDGKVHITSVLDNLLKGAAGQAIQNMNIMFGFDESLGLNLKANFF